MYNTYDEMLKLLIQYDKKLITKEEFEQKKIDLLLEEKQLIRNEDLAALPVFHPNSQKEEKKAQAALKVKRLAVLLISMVVLGCITGLLFMNWQEHQSNPPLTEEPQVNPNGLPGFSLAWTDYLHLTPAELTGKLGEPQEILAEVSKQGAESYPLQIYVYPATAARQAKLKFFFWQDQLVRLQAIAPEQWAYTTDQAIAQDFGIVLSATAQLISKADGAHIYHRVSDTVEEMAIYNITDAGGYNSVALTFQQRIFGGLAVTNPDFYWAGAQNMVKAALARPETAVFSTDPQDHRILEYQGKIWITSTVTYTNSAGEKITSEFVARFLPGDAENPNYLAIDGDVLYEWS
ncbi:MAG: hypothetical protein LLG09_00075 [Negativicutes bacterium]|nr:hypothetical protein [Negativicutes bacterium]